MKKTLPFIQHDTIVKGIHKSPDTNRRWTRLNADLNDEQEQVPHISYIPNIRYASKAQAVKQHQENIRMMTQLAKI